jgi:hypothetical protein
MNSVRRTLLPICYQSLGKTVAATRNDQTLPSLVAQPMQEGNMHDQGLGQNEYGSESVSHHDLLTADALTFVAQVLYICIIPYHAHDRRRSFIVTISSLNTQI